MNCIVLTLNGTHPAEQRARGCPCWAVRCCLSGNGTGRQGGPREISHAETISESLQRTRGNNTNTAGAGKRARNHAGKQNFECVHTAHRDGHSQTAHPPAPAASTHWHTCQKMPRYCDAHFRSMRVQQRKLFLDFAENFSLPANDPEKKKVGAKKKRLPGVIVGRALVLLT